MSDANKIGPGPTGRAAVLDTTVGDVFGEDSRRDAWCVFDGEPFDVTEGRCSTVFSEADARLLVYGSPWGGLDDEAAGRAWCAVYGKRPSHCVWAKPRHGPWRWRVSGGDGPHSLPAILDDALQPDYSKGREWMRGASDSEAGCYANLGATLKRIAAVLNPPVPA